MRLVKQKGKYTTDCGICCVAMIVDESRDEVKRKMCDLNCFNGNGYRTDYYDIKKALKAYGFKPSNTCSAKELKSEQKKAIVKINKKTNGYWHWVVYDPARKRTNRILDPAHKPVKKCKVVSYIRINRR